METPAALIDSVKMQRNIQRMQARMNTLGVRLRPHIKTSKCLPVIQAQIAAGALGVTVSTLKEAEYCFANSITDVLYAVAMAPGKLPQALALIRQGCRLGIITDSVAGAQAQAQPQPAARAPGRTPCKIWLCPCFRHRKPRTPP